MTRRPPRILRLRGLWSLAAGDRGVRAQLPSLGRASSEAVTLQSCLASEARPGHACVGPAWLLLFSFPFLLPLGPCRSPPCRTTHTQILISGAASGLLDVAYALKIPSSSPENLITERNAHSLVPQPAPGGGKLPLSLAASSGTWGPCNISPTPSFSLLPPHSSAQAPLLHLD